MADKDLTFKLFGQDVSASRALKKVGDQAQATARQVESSTRSASASTIALGTNLGILATKLEQGVASMATLGVSTAASMQQAQIGFTTLLGSAEKAGAYLEQLKDFATATPFEFGGLVDSSRLLLGVGVEAKQVIPILTALGDASGALAIDQAAFQRIMVAVSQSIGAGRIQLADMNQLMNNGLPIWTLLSKAIGKPVPELRKMIEQGQLMSSDVLPKLFAQMNKDYGGAMAAQSKTLTGLWSTLKDTLAQGLADALQPVIPTIQDGLVRAIALASQSLERLSQWFITNEAAIRDFGNALAGGAQWVMNHAGLLLQLAEGAAAALAAYKLLTGAQLLLNLAMSANPAGAIILGLSVLAGLFVVLWQRSKTFREMASLAFSVVAGNVQVMVKAVATGIRVVLLTAAQVVGVFDKDMAASLRNAAANVASTAASMDANIQAIRDRVVNIVVATSYVNGGSLGAAQAMSGMKDRASRTNGVVQRASSASSVTPRITLPGGAGGLPSSGGGGGGSKKSAAATARGEVVADLKVLAAQLTKSRQIAGKAFANLAGDVSRAGSSAARAIVNSYAKVVLPLAQRYETVVKSLKAQQEKLKKLREDAAQYAAQVKQSVIDSAKIADQESVGGIVTSLRESVAYAQQFAAALAKLRSLGADQATISQLVAAGPKQGLKLAEQLAAGGKGTVTEVAKLQAQLESAAGTLGTSASVAMYGAGIKAAEGLVKGLQSQAAKLAAAMAKLAATMVTAIKKALKIKSPSQAFAEVGAYSGLGLIDGLRSQYGAVQDAAAGMMGRIGAANTRTAGMAAAAGSGATIIHIHSAVVGDEAHLARTVTAALGRRKALGAA